jgi:hypothetical protein
LAKLDPAIRVQLAGLPSFNMALEHSACATAGCIAPTARLAQQPINIIPRSLADTEPVASILWLMLLASLWAASQEIVLSSQSGADDRKCWNAIAETM